MQYRTTGITFMYVLTQPNWLLSCSPQFGTYIVWKNLMQICLVGISNYT